jgi:hypothetical protein
MVGFIDPLGSVKCPADSCAETKPVAAARKAANAVVASHPVHAGPDVAPAGVRNAGGAWRGAPPFFDASLVMREPLVRDTYSSCLASPSVVAIIDHFCPGPDREIRFSRVDIIGMGERGVHVWIFQRCKHITVAVCKQNGARRSRAFD